MLSFVKDLNEIEDDEEETGADEKSDESLQD